MLTPSLLPSLKSQKQISALGGVLLRRKRAEILSPTLKKHRNTHRYYIENTIILLINFLFPLTYSSGSDIAPGQIIFCARCAVFDARRNLPTLMDYQWAAWCITVAIAMSLVRSCYASLNCSALCKPSASFISSCITLGLLKTAHPPKTRTTSVNGFLCWVDRLLLSPTGGMVTLLMFIQFAALLNRELGAGVLVVSSLSIAKNPVTFTIWTPACAA